VKNSTHIFCSISYQPYKLTDRNNQNDSYYCNSCGIDFQPDNENVRRETKLSVPDRNQEALVTTTPGIDYLNRSIEINHTPEPKGTFKVLQQKGIKIKDYKETDGAGRTIS
jgi:transposase-like protein